MADLWLEPYEEGVGEFPVTGSAREQLVAALRHAIRAPSVHNTQPWLLRYRGRRLEIHADRRRRLQRADPDGRELVISCGALVEHVVIVLRRFGFDAEVVYHDAGDHLASVGVGAPRRVDPLDRELFDAIPSRRTNRRPFRRRTVPALALERATRRALQRGCRLTVLGRTGRRRLVELVAEADRRQMADPAFRRELARWLRPARTSRRDGIPSPSGKAPRLVRPVAPLLVRTFDVGEGVAAFDRHLAAGSPVLAVLWTERDDRQAWLDAGRGLARTLLSLAADGLAASFLNQATEEPDVRARVDALIQPGARSQAVLRVGYGTAVPATPRRPVAALLRS